MYSPRETRACKGTTPEQIPRRRRCKLRGNISTGWPLRRSRDSSPPLDHGIEVKFKSRPAGEREKASEIYHRHYVAISDTFVTEYLTLQNYTGLPLVSHTDASPLPRRKCTRFYLSPRPDATFHNESPVNLSTSPPSTLFSSFFPRSVSSFSSPFIFFFFFLFLFFVPQFLSRIRDTG